MSGLPTYIPGNPTPDTWQAFLNMLSSMTTDTKSLPSTGYEGLLDFLYSNYSEVTNVAGERIGWALTRPVDPTITNAVVNSGLTGLATDPTTTAIVTTSGAGSYALATIPTVLGGILAVLGIGLTAGLVAQGIQNALEEEMVDWTVDGQYIPVWIDGLGMTTVQEGLIDAVRSKAIELGFFSTGSFEGRTADSNLRDPEYYNQPIKFNIGSAAVYSREYNPESYYFENEAGTAIISFLYPNQRYFRTVMLSKTLQNIHYRREYTSGGDPYDAEYSMTRQATKNGDVYYYYTGTFNYNDINSAVVTRDFEVNNLPTSNYSTDDLAAICLFGDVSGGQSVEGTTIFDDFANKFKDTSKTIKQIADDAFTTWSNSASALPNPTEDDITHTDNWFPVSLETTQPFEDGTTSDSTAQDGDVDDTVKDSILQLFKTLTDFMNPTPPDVPVEDTGDTPPALPPLISGASNGLWCIYNPSLAQVQQFGGWLWSENLIDQIVRQFNNPIEAVIGFHMMYAVPIIGATRVIKAGYLESPVSAPEVVNQYIEINCGTVPIQEYYGTAIDYTKTKIDLFLPFIGVVPLDASVVMGSSLVVIYRIDVLTGTCLAQVKVIKQNSNAVLYTYNGNCAVQLPLTASTYTGMVGALVNLGQAALSGFIGDPISAGGELGQAVGSLISNKTGTAKSGYIGANAGSLGIRIPYVIITHPTAYDAYMYNEMYGYPSNTSVTLSSQRGFTRVKDIHPVGISATENEVDMIVNLLKQGVIIN